MNEHEEIFTKAVWTKLKGLVRGHVFCKIVDDTLQVSIKCCDNVWRTNVENMSERIISGKITGESCAFDIFKSYKKEMKKKLMHTYFKNPLNRLIGFNADMIIIDEGPWISDRKEINVDKEVR